MALAFNTICYWLCGAKNHESCNSTQHSSSDAPSVLREPDSVKFLCLNGDRMRSSSRKVKRKWQSREERRIRIDRGFDMVIVPSDGGCLSDSESDDSDWSIGWMEPHSADFMMKNSDKESSFAVLVPCYSGGRFEKFADQRTEFEFSSEDDDYIERWLSTLHNM